MSPSAIAEEMGFHRSDVTRWSKGSQPRQATLQKIANYFDVSISDLTGETQKSGPTLVSESRPLYPPEYDLLSDEDKALVDNMIRSLAKKK